RYTLTRKEAADRLELTEQTVTRWAREGKLPAIGVGKQRRYDAGAVDAIVAAKIRRTQLLGTPYAAAKLDITPAQPRELAWRHGWAPEGWYENPYCRSGPECPLWKPEDVLAVADGPEVTAYRARNAERRERMRLAEERRTTKRRAEVAQKYPNWRVA